MRLTERKRNSDGTGIAKQNLIKDNGCFTRFTDEILTKLAEYEDLEEQGRLVKLSCDFPCKIGDIVYRTNAGAKEPIIAMRITQVLIKQLKDRTVITFNTMNDNDNGENCYTLEDVGVKVFLTKEEAAEKVKFMTSYHNGFNDGYNKAIDDIYAKSFKEYNEQIAYEEICSILKDKLMKLKKDEQSKWDECNVRKAFDDSEEKISCNCQHNSNPRDNELCRICDGKQTNADKIRNMSDEELASWYVIKCEIMMGTKCQKPFKTCKDCILDWLQSEAE